MTYRQRSEPYSWYSTISNPSLLFCLFVFPYHTRRGLSLFLRRHQLSLSLAVKLIGVKAFRPECCYCCWLRVYCSYISSLIRYLSFFFTFFYSSRFFFSRFIALTLFISSTEKFRRQWGYIYRHIKGDDVTKPEKKVKPKPKPDSFIFLFFILWLRVFKVIFFSNP